MSGSSNPGPERKGAYGGSVQISSGVWYSEPRIEVFALSEPGPRGGAPRRAQILLSLEDARLLFEDLKAALADPSG